CRPGSPRCATPSTRSARSRHARGTSRRLGVVRRTRRAGGDLDPSAPHTRWAHRRGRLRSRPCHRRTRRRGTRPRRRGDRPGATAAACPRHRAVRRDGAALRRTRQRRHHDDVQYRRGAGVSRRRSPGTAARTVGGPARAGAGPARPVRQLVAARRSRHRARQRPLAVGDGYRTRAHPPGFRRPRPGRDVGAPGPRYAADGAAQTRRSVGRARQADLRRLDRPPRGGTWMAPAHGRRPRLPPHHPVHPGAAERSPRGAVPRRPAAAAAGRPRGRARGTAAPPGHNGPGAGPVRVRRRPMGHRGAARARRPRPRAGRGPRRRARLHRAGRARARAARRRRDHHRRPRPSRPAATAAPAARRQPGPEAIGTGIAIGTGFGIGFGIGIAAHQEEDAMSTETSPQTPARTPSATANGNVAPEDIRVRAAAALERARTRTAALTDIDDDELTRQHSRLMSPLVWDLAHVGSQEEIWLVRDVGGREPLRPDIDELYDAFRHARADRPALPLLGPAEARAYVDQVRRKALDTLESAPMEGRRLTESAFAFGMIAQHEQQHDETMLATHQLRRGEPLLHAPAPPVRRAGPAPEEVVVPAGRFVMGTSAEPWALDNERPAHEVFVDGFAIDTFPVTCDRYAAFVDAGGYRDPRWWSTEGWDYITAHGITAPRFWRFDGGRWWRRRFGVYEPVPDDEPVLHVSFHEAEAYAAWAGRRLPTEAEWEKAARHDPATGRSRRYP